MQRQRDRRNHRSLALLGSCALFACASPESGVGQPGNGSGASAQSSSGGAPAGGVGPSDKGTGGSLIPASGGVAGAGGGSGAATVGGVRSSAGDSSGGNVDNYQANLMKYVTDARAKSVTPVILTPVSRSSGTTANPGFAGVDQLARDIAAQQNVALIDLTALSRTYYTTVPDKNALFIDGTHFHEVGAIGVAGVIAQAIKSSSLPLKTFVK